MHVKVTKWGNSLGLRIPKALADEARIAEGMEVEVRTTSNGLSVTPRSRVTLADILHSLDSCEGAPGEIDTGKPVGQEIW